MLLEWSREQDERGMSLVFAGEMRGSDWQRARPREEVRKKTMLYHHLLACWALSLKVMEEGLCVKWEAFFSAQEERKKIPRK